MAQVTIDTHVGVSVKYSLLTILTSIIVCQQHLLKAHNYKFKEKLFKDS
jgi:hypothetical protein